MALTQTGRTTKRHVRLYGGDATHAAALCETLSGIGELVAGTDMPTEAAYCDNIIGALPGHAVNAIGPLNLLLSMSAAATSPHVVMQALVGLPISLCAAIGIREAPAIGAPAFVTQGVLKSYAYEGDGFIHATANIIPDGVTPLAYRQPWGVLLHPSGAETGANSSTADVVDNGAATAGGGYLFWGLLALDAGTATISVDDSADNSTWTALSGATSGAQGAVGCGIVQLGTTATVKRYTRWQLALAGGATSATFILAFVRG